MGSAVSTPWPSIEPGRLRHTIVIQKPTETKSADADGSIAQTWETHAANVPAEVTRRMGPGERYAAQALQTSKSYLVIMRYCAGVTEKMRVSWDGRIFDIKDVNDVDGRHIKHVLIVLERTYDETGARVQ